MGVPGGAEKRQFNRYEFQKWVQIFPVLPSGTGSVWEVQPTHVGAWANNISEGGLQIESVHPFDAQFPLKLNIEFEKGRIIEAYGKLVWSHDNHCGIQFMWLDQRLRNGIQTFAGKKNSLV